MDVPWLSVAEMRRIEEVATQHFGIEPLQLMEQAGASVAAHAREAAGVRGRTITVLCGKGRNGGDGLVAARLLANWGAQVNVILASHPDELDPLTRDHYGTATSMHLNRMTAVDNLQWQLAMKQSDLLIDALLGHGLEGDPRGQYAELIRLANQSGKRILAVDCPSGLDCDTGLPREPCVCATETVTFTLPKKGLTAKEAGRVWVAEVGIPFQVFELLGLSVPRLFRKSSIIRVR